MVAAAKVPLFTRTWEFPDLDQRRYRIDIMSRAELDLAVDWAAEEGWNPGLHDAESFLAADPGGFLVGRLDGEPVASISAVRYGSGFGFIGFYIVRPGFRGQGFGLAVWKAAMQRLEGRSIGLDGVIEQQGNYRKSGFVLAHRNVRNAGRAGDCVRALPAAADVVDVSTLPFPMLRDYDRSFFPEDRSAFLERWVAPPDGHALACIRPGGLRGYGVIRRCRSGYKLGPLFADDAAIARGLMSALCARVPAEAEVFLDVPETNPSAVRLASECGMSPVFETARMYTGSAPGMPIERLFGVTTFELG